tara:strand:- start:278 stop:721 length:444 start_codon:yes stop_codon:yes gene_type:complete
MSGIIGGAGSKSGVIGTTELDYEEGSYTATMTSASGSFANFAQNTGRYILTGKLVWVRVEFKIGASGNGNASGDLYFNLPFAVKNQSSIHGIDFIATGSEQYATGTMLQGRFQRGLNSLVNIKSNDHANVGPANNYSYVMSMQYEVA